MAEKTHPDWLTEEALLTLSKGYLFKQETVDGLYKRVSKQAVKVLKSIPPVGDDDDRVKNLVDWAHLEEDLYQILWNGWLGLASPVAANFGTTRGLPVSCYATHLADSVTSIYSHLKETAQLTKYGGGIGVFFGDIRPIGSPFGQKQGENGRSSGIVPWAQSYDQAARIVTQGNVRRGSFAMYLPIEHPDVLDLLKAKDHTQGDPRQFIDSNIGLTISDDWLYSMLEGDTAKQDLFVEVLKTRFMTGSPYLVFIDNVNRANPLAYKERGLSVSTSNLCSEITLYTDDNHSFVCVLSSLNLAKYRDWQNWTGKSGLTLTQLSIYLLEAVIEDFINKASRMSTMGRALRSARKGRALGLGVMGLHQLYQQENLPFASSGARKLNKSIFSRMKKDATQASQKLAKIFGEPEWCKGYGQRHTHLLAIAPTRTNAMITAAGSQGIEPIDSNFFIGKQSSGSFVRKNTILQKTLQKLGRDTQETWDSIRNHGGSVQHLDFLGAETREVFKTAYEIDQKELIQQAADRQPYICQAQSLNLFFSPNISTEDLLQIHLRAWKLNVKSLYYLKTKALNLLKKSLPPEESCKTPSATGGRPDIFLLTKPTCTFCDKVKDVLSKKGYKYQEIDYAGNPNYRNGDKKWTTVPQVFFDTKHIGGYQETLRHLGISASEEKESECVACEG